MCFMKHHQGSQAHKGWSSFHNVLTLGLSHCKFQLICTRGFLVIDKNVMTSQF